MQSLTLIIFGITSNLAQIKLIPALYDMEENGTMPEKFTIIGTSRQPYTKEQLAEYVSLTLYSANKHHAHDINPDILKKLTERMFHFAGNLDDPEFYPKLNEYVLEKSQPLSKEDNRIYYLATYPDLYHHVFDNLQKNGMNEQKNGFVRLMIEKPIGNDLESAKELNALLLTYFEESQIYRLDHYLGKETLQNILSFRFANSIFEPLIRSEYIDHIQITASENFGIGKRGGYFDTVGSLKDVGQNHELQMLAFATMDAPTELVNKAITEERLKILNSLQPLPEKIVFGQYQGYRNEENVMKDSNADTFFAFKTLIDNERFRDVPIYIRAGKMMKETVTEISIIFKKPKNLLYSQLKEDSTPNILIYRIQPNEGIVLRIFTKKPGHTMELGEEFMQFCYRVDPKSHSLPDPYERLLSDAIRGDQTFFNDAAEVEAQWKFIDPLVAAKTEPKLYLQGSWGPAEADELIEADGRKWLEPSPDFCRI